MLKVLQRISIRKSRSATSPATPSAKDMEAKSIPAAPSKDEEPTEPLEESPPNLVRLSSSEKPEELPPATIVIAGGGIVGLLLALALNKYINVQPEVYEQAAGYAPDVGAGMGLYANGLRVIQDIDPELLEEIQKAGHPYVYRRWERHDGTEVAVADESVLGSQGDCPLARGEGLQTMGIRRWKLQQCLHAAVKKAGIPIYFGKKVSAVTTPENGTTEVIFTDGGRRQTQLLIGADGGRSSVRASLLPTKKQYDDEGNVETPILSYTGVTCIMGVAENSENSRQGISMPVSNTTQCHGAFYPTGGDEQCFQFHFPIAHKHNECGVGHREDSCWGTLSQQVSLEECSKLANILKNDGWDEEKYLKPLREVTKAVRVGFCQLTPALKHWSFPNAQGQPRAILVGDAAHPPVPYIGQGAQQGMEDAGTLALLLKEFCLDDQGQFDLRNLNYAVKVYENLRIPRVNDILENGRLHGKTQQKRAQSAAYNIVKEEKIQRDIFFHETVPIMFPGARHDYRHALDQELEEMAKQHDGPPLSSIAEA